MISRRGDMNYDLALRTRHRRCAGPAARESRRPAQTAHTQTKSTPPSPRSPRASCDTSEAEGAYHRMTRAIIRHTLGGHSRARTGAAEVGRQRTPAGALEEGAHSPGPRYTSRQRA